MGRLFIRMVVTAAALFVAIVLVPGVDMAGISANTVPPVQTWINLALIAVIFALVNAIVRPILKGMTCALSCFTLGLFIFVINALMLFLTSLIAQQLDLGLIVDGPVAALLGSLVVSVVNVVLSVFVPDKKD